MEHTENRYIEFLLSRVPNLKQEFDKHTISEEDSTFAAAEVYEDIFVPYIIKQLVLDNREEIIKITDFIEELFEINDADYRDYDFLASCVLNDLRKDQDGQRIKEFLQEKSLNALHDLIENSDKRFNELLLSRFPSLKQEFDEWTSWQDGIDTSAMLTYEDVLNPYIFKQLALDNREEIIKIADFIEEFLNIDDYALNIAEVGILEALRSKQEGQKIRPFLKEKSLEIYDNLSMFRKP